MQFSFVRFSYLFKLQLAANRKLYLLGIAAITGMMLCYMFLAVFTFENGFKFETQIDFISIALILSGSFFTSLIFKQYGDKNKRIQSILLPVSNTERLGVAVLFTFFLFPLVFILLYFICLSIANAVDVHVLGNMNDMYMLDGIEGGYMFMIFFLVQSVSLLGAIWFRRFTFVKTAVLACVAIIFFSSANELVNKMILDKPEERAAAYYALTNKDPRFPSVHFELVGSPPFQSLRFYGKTNYGYYVDRTSYWVSLPVNQTIGFTIFLGLIPFFFFYVVSVKLREQQL